MWLAEVLENREDDIVALWLGKARSTAAARGLSDRELADSFAKYVHSLSRALRLPAIPLDERAIIEHHLATRLRFGYRLDEVVHEYTLLSGVIASLELDLPLRRPTSDDLDRLFAAIDRAIAMALQTYGKHLTEHEQPQNRFLRLIEKVASDAVLEKARFEDRLDDVCDLLREALATDSAAIFLLDPTRIRLDRVAAVGSSGKLPFVSLPLVGGGFVAGIATAGTLGAYTHAEDSGGTDPSGPISSGNDAHLGHPLTAPGAVTGVLCVGLRGGARFEPWQERRIAAIAQRLGLLLENARLFREREESISLLEAERAARERFVSMLAHDLRGPVATARLAAELLDRRAGPVGHTRVLTTKIQDQLKRMEAMIHDLLDANRLRAGLPLALVLDDVALTPLLEDVIGDLISMHGDRFRIDGRTGVHGHWSHSQLRRAVWNLLTNAVKYGSPSTVIGVEVTVAAEHAFIAVHNEGNVLDHAQRIELFKPFSRLHSNDGAGWGLGLTFVRGCAEAHGGTVRVESEPGLGTTFVMDLPLGQQSITERHS